MLLTIFSFIFVLSLLVFFHEGGHYLAARFVGVRVQQFSIGFPPRMIGRKMGDTEYLISWIPLGGYVKLEGQNIDDEDPSDPHNYASKTILQRLFILAAGPAMNVAVAFMMMPLVYLIGVETPTYRLGPADLADTVPGSPAEKTGFLPGDRILSMGGTATPTWKAVSRQIAEQAIGADVITFEVERNGRRVLLPAVTRPFLGDKPFGWKPLMPAEVGLVLPDSPARGAGLLKGDRILSINGEPISEWGHIPEQIQKGQGSEIAFEIERGEERLLLKLRPEFNEELERWMIGISPATSLEQHGPVDAFLLGGERLWDITSATFVFLGRMFTGHGSMESLGGPVKIGVVIGEAARTGASNLIFLMAVISIQLGIFNLLPIPALDGGHIFMLGIERLKGAPLSAKLRERAQMVGFSLLILLILIVTYNDILQILT